MCILRVLWNSACDLIVMKCNGISKKQNYNLIYIFQISSNRGLLYGMHVKIIHWKKGTNFHFKQHFLPNVQKQFSIKMIFYYKGMSFSLNFYTVNEFVFGVSVDEYVFNMQNVQKYDFIVLSTKSFGLL